VDVIFEAAGIAFSPNEQDIPLRRVSIYLCSIHSWNMTECEQSITRRIDSIVHVVTKTKTARAYTK